MVRDRGSDSRAIAPGIPADSVAAGGPARDAAAEAANEAVKVRLGVSAPGVPSR
jgi:hypothetical protein